MSKHRTSFKELWRAFVQYEDPDAGASITIGVYALIPIILGIALFHGIAGKLGAHLFAEHPKYWMFILSPVVWVTIGGICVVGVAFLRYLSIRKHDEAAERLAKAYQEGTD